jgi:hypothetical protein
MAVNPPTVLDLVAQYRSALARADTAAMTRIVGVYKSMYDRITPQIQALADVVSTGEYTTAQVYKLRQFIALQKSIQSELTDFTGYLRTDLQPLALKAAQMGDADAYKTLKFIVGDRELIRVMFDRIPIETVYQMLTFLDPKGALYQRIGQLAPYHAEQVSQAIMDAVGMGVNPRQTARLIMSAAEQSFGGGLTDALRTARTAQLYSYREATRANYAANSDVVTGWIWCAELDDLTCEACLAENGTRHDIEESLDGHYNCRCSPIPEVMGQNPVAMQTGEDWFNDQTEETQRSIMGDTKWEAWNAGQFQFSDMVKDTPNDVYGNMKTVTPLNELLGMGAPSDIGSYSDAVSAFEAGQGERLGGGAQSIVTRVGDYVVKTATPGNEIIYSTYADRWEQAAKEFSFIPNTSMVLADDPAGGKRWLQVMNYIAPGTPDVTWGDVQKIVDSASAKGWNLGGDLEPNKNVIRGSDGRVYLIDLGFITPPGKNY